MASTYINLPNVVTGPNTSTVGNLAAYGVTNGSVLTDSGVSAAGVVVGPASSVDNTIPRFDGITGKLLQTSRVIIDDSDNLVMPTVSAGGQANIKFTAAPSGSYDTNLLHVSSAGYTMGMICGPTPVYFPANGPFIGLRGNEYVNVGSQRGLLFIAAGSPTAAGAGEGEVQILTGASAAVRLRVSRTGVITVGSHTGVGQLDVKSSAVAIVPLIVDTQAAHAADVLQLKINGTSKAVMTSAGKFVVGGTATLGNTVGMFITDSGSYTPIAMQSTAASGYAQLDMYNSASANVGGFGYGNANVGAVAARDHTYFYSVAKDFHISTDSNVTRHMILAASTGAMSLSNLISNGGAVTSLTVTSAAHTAQTASTEIPNLYLNFAATRTWATGAISEQSEIKIIAPTYAFVAASTITTVSTVNTISAPNAGTNATFTNVAAMRVGGNVNIGATSASMTYAAFDAPSHTVTVSGAVNVTSNPGMAVMHLHRLTVTNAGAVTIDNASTLFIANAPLAAGLVTLTNTYAIYSAAGLNRFDGNGTHVFELPADATAPGALTGRIPIKVGGATKYLVYSDA